MSQYNRDRISRLEDLEALMTTARDLAARMTDQELDDTRECIGSALTEIRQAQQSLLSKWNCHDRE